MGDRGKQRKQASGRVWPVWLCLGPLLSAAFLFELLAPQLKVGQAYVVLPIVDPAGPIPPGFITYAAVVLVHFFVCIGTILFARDLIRHTPGSGRFAWAGLCVAGLAIAAFAVGAEFSLTAVRVTYEPFRVFFSHVAAGLVAGENPATTPLALAVLLPSMAGILAVAATAAAAWAQLPLQDHVLTDRHDTQPDRSLEESLRMKAAFAAAQAARINQLNDRLKRCLYVLALVLVTSTVAASLFFHLPANIAPPHDPASTRRLAALARFGDELSILWGCVYTMTLALAVGLPVCLLQDRVRRRLEPPFASDRAEARRRQLAAAGPLSTWTDQLRFVGTLLAPLVAGPAANIIQGFIKL